jgi:hypothetical protein
MSCEPDSQFRNRPHFVAVHESESGTKAKYPNGRYSDAMR